MGFSSTVAKCYPTLRYVTVRRKAQTRYNFADLVFVIEPWLQSIRSALDRGLIEILFDQTLPRFLNLLGGLRIFRSFGIHGCFENMPKQRVEFSKRVGGDGSRHPQFACSGRQAAKIRVTIRDCTSEQALKQGRGISLFRRKIECVDRCFRHRSAREGRRCRGASLFLFAPRPLEVFNQFRPNTRKRDALQLAGFCRSVARCGPRRRAAWQAARDGSQARSSARTQADHCRALTGLRGDRQR